MTKEEFVRFVSENYGVSADNPFSDIDALVFRHTENRKWFAIIMRAERGKIAKNGEERLVDILDVKTDPLIRADLLNKKGVYTAYHMNKVHWLTVVLEEVAKDDLEFLLDLSFNLTKARLRKAKRSNVLNCSF